MTRRSLQSLMDFKPKKVSMNEPVVKESLFDRKAYPLVIEPTINGLDLKNWTKSNRANIEAKLKKYGAVLFRGFAVQSREYFQEVIGQINADFLYYTDQSSPRTLLNKQIYTSTDHPSDQVINQHNELSYSNNWPLKIAFYCNIQPGSKGQTPICDVRKLLKLLPEDLVADFEKKGIRYRRFLQPGIGLSWQKVFGTENRAEVEAKCQEKEQQFEWRPNDSLVISWTLPAVRTHPFTGEKVWFNHGYFFNYLALNPEIRSAFSNEEELPFNTYYGDGTSISEATVETINKAYQDTKIKFDWKKGDILLLDNMLMAHGRESYTGDREINVVMSQPHH